MDALKLLKDDHDKIKKLLTQIDSTTVSLTALPTPAGPPPTTTTRRAEIAEATGAKKTGRGLGGLGDRATLVRTVNNTQATYSVHLKSLISDGDIGSNVVLEPGDILIIPQSYF